MRQKMDRAGAGWIVATKTQRAHQAKGRVRSLSVESLWATGL